MTVSPFHAMQAAVDIVNTSPHPVNKIAASIFGTDQSGAPFLISAINHWPPAILNAFGIDARIGSSSGTIHAETSCILQAPITAGAALAITDPFCPNCAKNIAEAGIKTIYIDHKGFAKDFAERRGDEFMTMSLRVVERAGISVYEINRKEQVITPIITPSPNYRPPEDKPVTLQSSPVTAFDRVVLIGMAEKFRTIARNVPYAVAWATGVDGRPRIMLAPAHVTVGYTEGSTADKLEMADMHSGKYSFVMEPVNRLMMAAARHGLKPDPRLIVSSRVPTAREQVNMVAAGLVNLHVLNPQDSRDVGSINALHQLTRAGVMVVG
jgi:deoxycytidylate deaminase